MLLAVLIVVALPLCFLVGMIVCDRLDGPVDEDASKTLMGALD
jgi:hypothetical protein